MAKLCGLGRGENRLLRERDPRQPLGLNGQLRVGPRQQELNGYTGEAGQHGDTFVTWTVRLPQNMGDPKGRP